MVIFRTSCVNSGGERREKGDGICDWNPFCAFLPLPSPFFVPAPLAIELDIFKNCEGSQRNMPQKVRSIKELISKK